MELNYETQLNHSPENQFDAIYDGRPRCRRLATSKCIMDDVSAQYSKAFIKFLSVDIVCQILN